MLLADPERYHQIEWFNRPKELEAEILYRPVDVALTPQLQTLGARAVDNLVTQGFTHQDAIERVNMHIHGAASFLSEDFADQAEAELAVGWLRDHRGEDSISAEAGMSLTPFLAVQAQFDFSPAHWMLNSLKLDGGGVATQYMFRWFDLWQDDVSQEDTKKILEATRYELELQLARYAGMIVARPNTTALTEAVKSITSDQYALPLFSQLGRSSKLVRALLDTPLGEKVLPANSRARAVQHTSRFAGDCACLEMHHLSSLYGSDRQVFVHSQGTVLGSLKLEGDKSMLSMVTMEDEGRFPLVRGGVYAVNIPVVEKAYQAQKQDGSGAIIEVDRLDVRPLRFIKSYVEGDMFTWNLEGTLAFLPQLEVIRAEQQAKLDAKSAAKARA